MNEVIPFLKALGIGITVSAPLGPVGVLCIRNTLERGMKHALSIGAGAALADTAYSFLAALGLTGVSFFFEKHCRLIQLIGGTALILLSFCELRASRPSLSVDAKMEKSLFVLAQKGFFLTLINPMTLFGLIGLFSSLGLTYGPEVHPLTIPLGVCVGCMMWWVFLSLLFQRSKKHLPASCFSWMRYGSALLLLGCGVLSLYGGVRKACLGSFEHTSL
jgi:putative LysE/RhtB family amino acid efflux pump